MQRGARWYFALPCSYEGSKQLPSYLATQMNKGRLKYYIYQLEVDDDNTLQYAGYTEWKNRMYLSVIGKYISGSTDSPIIVQRCDIRNDTALSRYRDNPSRIDGPWQKGVRTHIGRPPTSKNIQSIYADIETMMKNSMSDQEIYDAIGKMGYSKYYTHKAYGMVDDVRKRYQ